MKFFILSVLPLLVVLSTPIFSMTEPISQTLYFLVVFLLTCLSAMMLVERQRFFKRLNTVRPLYGIVIGILGLASFIGILIWLSPFLLQTGLGGRILTFILMYLGILILGFITGCFFEGITRQPKDQLIRPVFLFIGTGYMILTVFGILQLYHQAG